MKIPTTVASLLVACVAGGANADMVYSQSFEDTSWLGGKYYDVSGETGGHWLTNNEGQAAVNGTGFSAWVDGEGLVDGDYVGVTNYTPGSMGSYYDGSQGYQLSDTDGVMELHLDGYEGFADYISIAVFIADTGYEAADSVSLHWGDGDLGGTSLWELVGDDDLEGAGQAGIWIYLELDVSTLGAGHLHVRAENNSSSEAFYIDAYNVYAIPAPGALAVLGIAGLARRRRR